jgi:hypothetical protein
VERGLFCNGEKDCVDGSDENTCGTYWDMLQYFLKRMLKQQTHITKDTNQSHRSTKTVPLLGHSDKVKTSARGATKMRERRFLHSLLRAYRLRHIQVSNNFQDAVHVTKTKWVWSGRFLATISSLFKAC